MASVDFKLYMVTDRHQTAGRPLPEVIELAAKAGVPAVQFREKDLSLRAQFDLAAEIKEITSAYGVKLLVNDRVDLCLALDAAGVHLPSSGLPIPVARMLLGKEKLIGVSCHSSDEVKNAERCGADFAVLGPVFDTPSKRPYGVPLSLDYFRKTRSETNLPLFAIGGIGFEELKMVFSVGADGVAMISAISTASDIKARSRKLLQGIDSFSVSTRS